LLVTVTCRLVLAAGFAAFQVAGAPDHAMSDGMEKSVALMVLSLSAHGTHLSSTDLALVSPVR
jgi:hypothetical protein